MHETATISSSCHFVDMLQDEFIVVPEEPLVKLKYTSLLQGAMMLFEGER
jgi:hypothetical protein